MSLSVITSFPNIANFVEPQHFPVLYLCFPAQNKRLLPGCVTLKTPYLTKEDKNPTLLKNLLTVLCRRLGRPGVPGTRPPLPNINEPDRPVLVTV